MSENKSFEDQLNALKLKISQAGAALGSPFIDDIEARKQQKAESTAKENGSGQEKTEQKNTKGRGTRRSFHHQEFANAKSKNNADKVAESNNTRGKDDASVSQNKMKNQSQQTKQIIKTGRLNQNNATGNAVKNTQQNVKNHEQGGRKKLSTQKQDVTIPAAKPLSTRVSTNQKTQVTPVKIISLGGLNEIGKNITIYECGNDAIIVDCGLAFPDSEMPGVDLVIPDFTYVEKIKDKIRGVIITHGHEDHIGSLPYLMDIIDTPIYGTRLTLGLVEGKLKEKGNLSKCKLQIVKPKTVLQLGLFSVEFIRVNHSIPDAVALAISTPAGVIIQTGDFKVDYTPVDDEVIDLRRFGELGNNGVLALLSDSTNADRPGYSMSERKVGESFMRLFERSGNRRIIIATFSSNIHRIQQIVEAAVRYERRLVVSGRSMVTVVSKAIELGYLTVPDGLMVDISDIKKYRPEQLVVVTTGSQGEPMSALSRLAMGDHRQMEATKDDYIIISATPIPGNEKFVNKVVNELMRMGSEVVYEAMYEVHTSGHAFQEEMKLMLGLVKPQFFMPVHGEFKHLKKHADLALSMGINPNNIIISDIGKVVETDGRTMKITGQVPSGKVMVDGLGVGDVGSIVLRDRKHLAEDGIIIVVMGIGSGSHKIAAGPEIISRGFVYVRESEELMDGVRKVIVNALDECASKNVRDWATIKSSVRDALSNFVYFKTKRSPMILPVILEIEK